VLLPGPGWVYNPPTSTSRVAGIAGMNHHEWPSSTVFVLIRVIW
jgi:hypothetical protein